MRPEKIMRLLEEIDALRSGNIDPFLQACEADFRGRKGLQGRAYPQADYLRAALDAALAINARDLQLNDVEGVEIGQRLRAARIAAIAELPVERGEQSPERSR
jgi:tRNA nucleotidyltransferase (CCA-adding enzyme)